MRRRERREKFFEKNAWLIRHRFFIYKGSPAEYLCVAGKEGAGDKTVPRRDKE